MPTQTNILQYFLRRKTDTEADIKKKLTFAKWSSEKFPLEEWDSLDYYLVAFIYHMAEIDSLLNAEYLEKLCALRLKELIYHGKVKTLSTQTLNLKDPILLNEAVRLIEGELYDYVEELSNQPVDIANFGIDLQVFMQEQKERKFRYLLETGVQIRNTGVGEKIGVTDASNFMLTELAKLEEYYSDNALLELYEYLGSKTEEELDTILGDTGLGPLDSSLRGWIPGKLYGIEASSGAGKTRFMVFLAYRMVRKFGLRVRMYALEQSVKELENMFIALHIFMTSNQKIRLPDIEILLLKKLSPELQERVAIARYELFEAEETKGKISISAPTSMNSDEIFSKLSRDDTMFGPFDVFFIDYMYLLTSTNPRAEQTEIIRTGYRQFKSFCRVKKKVGGAINQLNREGEEAVNNDKMPPMNGAAGGYEVYRNTDYNIVLGAPEVLKAQRMRKLWLPKTRFSDVSPGFIVDTALDVCFFYIKIAR